MKHGMIAMLLLLLPAGAAVSQTTSGADADTLARQTSRFLEAFARKDADGIVAMWDPAAPVPKVRSDLERIFLPNTVRVTSEGAVRAEVTGDKARTRFTADIEVVDERGGPAAPDFGAGEYYVDWARTGSGWKIAKRGNAEALLADTLIQTKDASERAQLLKAGGGMVNIRLVRAIDHEAATRILEGDAGEARSIAAVGIEAAVATGSRFALGTVKLQMGDVENAAFQYAAARSRFQEALVDFTAANDLPGQAAAHGGIAKVEVLLDRSEQAAPEFQTCLRLARSAKDRQVESTCLSAQGEALRRQGELDAARDVFAAALRLDRELADPSGEASDLVNMANIYSRKGAYEEALSSYRQSLTINVRMVDKPEQSIDLLNIGNVQEALGEYASAIETLNRCIALKKQITDREGEAFAMGNIGNVLFDQGKYDEALAQYEASLKVAETAESKAARSNALASMGNVYTQTGRYGQALPLYRASLDLERERKDPLGQATALGSIALLSVYAGRFRESLSVFEQARGIFHDKGAKPEEAITLHNMAEIRVSLKEYRTAKQLLDSSLALKKSVHDYPGQVLDLQTSAAIDRIQGQYKAGLRLALDAIDLARAHHDARGEALSLATEGDLLRLSGEPAKAELSYAGALRLGTDVGMPDMVAAAESGLGEDALLGKRFDEAASHCRNGIVAVERIRSGAGDSSARMGAVSMNMAPYHCLIAAELGRNRTEAALLASESARARSLLELIGRNGPDLEKELQPAERTQLGELEAQSASLYQNLGQTPSKELADRFVQARTEEEVYRHELEAAHPGFGVRAGRIPAAGLAQLAELIPDAKTAFLEYVIGEKRSWVFVLRRSGGEGSAPELSYRPLSITAAELEQLTGNMLERIAKANGAAEEARTLYDRLIGPAAAALNGVKTIGIVADQALWRLPFAALVDGRGHYLVESHATFLAPSLTHLLAMRRASEERTARQAGGPLMVVSNGAAVNLPFYGYLEPIPGVYTEGRAVARAVPGSKWLSGPNATESAVVAELPKHRVVYFAGHVVIDEVNPMYSGLVLRKTLGGKDDGLLQAREIAQMNLAADLAVVSGCDTALGDIYGGEGIVGISWAFFAAGTPSSVLALWKIDDTATATLMPAFFGQWRKAPPDGKQYAKAAALQAALLAFLKKPPTEKMEDPARRGFAKPSYWAAFVLIGDGR